jgi:phage terminase large subunit-like protein
LGNCQAKTDANNNRRPIKRQKDDYKTIDGVVAMIMALQDAICQDPGVGFYDEHDGEWL